MLIAYINNNTRPSTFAPVKILDYTPVVTPRDKERGEILRYFTRPTHQQAHTDIQEIDAVTYNTLRSNKFYTVVQIRWNITGPQLDEVQLTESGDTIKIRSGVESGNQRIVKLADEKLPGLVNAITNYMRFYQGM